MSSSLNDMPEHPFVRLGRLKAAGERAMPQIKELVAACKVGDLKTVQKLIDENVDLEAADPTDDGLDTPVWAAMYGRQPKVIELLAKAGADLNAGTSHPAEVAIDWGHVELLTALLGGGVDPDTIIPSGESLLRYAVMKKQLAAVAALVKAGADVNMVPQRSNRMPSRISAAQVAASYGMKDVVKLLVDAGANADGLERLLLSAAARAGDVDAIKAAIAAGIDVNSRDVNGMTLLHAVVTIDDDEEKVTPAMLEIVRLLLEAGADKRAKDPMSDQTPLTLAKDAGLKKVVELLKAPAPKKKPAKRK